MFRNFFWITLLALLVVGLISGAVNRTLAKTGNDSLVEAVTADNGRADNARTGNANEAASAQAGISEDCEAEGEQDGNGYSYGEGNSTAASDEGQVANTAHEELVLPEADPLGVSEEAAEGLAFMLEEEKLAHDVYTSLYDLWGKQAFANIANGEQAHFEAVLTLLERYNLEVPASEAPGAFTNDELQTLHDRLMSLGSQSLEDALRVGALIEEIDILDLQERLAQTDQADIQQVYNNLLSGSYNHLRAFSRVLQNQTGVTYQPQVLAEASYQEILAGAQGNQGGKP